MVQPVRCSSGLFDKSFNIVVAPCDTSRMRRRLTHAIDLSPADAAYLEIIAVPIDALRPRAPEPSLPPMITPLDAGASFLSSRGPHAAPLATPRARGQLGPFKLPFLAVVLLLVLGTAACKKDGDAAPARRETLASVDGRFRVTAPSAWVPLPSEGRPDELALIDRDHAMSLRLIPGVRYGGDDLAEYAGLARDTIKRKLSSKDSALQLDPTTDTTLAGKPAKRTELRFTDAGSPNRFVLYALATPAQFVQIVVTGPQDAARWKASEIDAVLASVAITDPPAPAASAGAH
jgi:hypothetical protein